MWNKALWYREYQQLGIRIWIIVVLHFFLIGFVRLNDWIWEHPDDIARSISYISIWLDVYQDGVYEALARYYLVFVAMLLSIILVSAERRNGKQEMLFSLPYRRQDIFAVKWLFGASIVTGSLLLNTVIDMIIMLTSPVSEYVVFSYYAEQFLYSGVVVLGMYSVAMFLATISGSAASHSVYLFMIHALPIYLWEMSLAVLEAHGFASPSWEEAQQWTEWIYLTSHIGERYTEFSSTAYILFSVFIVGFTAAGAYMYGRNRLENNGKLMITKMWERVLQIGFVGCFALLIAIIVYAIVGQNLAGYYIGLFIGIAFGTWMIRRMTALRLKI